ncbi:proton-coupled folate transporter-like [Danaus plexippus]|uniref:proton-coupled folate transporter-like n=1 Tax=Danaus plexippus TaxID=13037 RepID=UPI002AB25288|nr:proton-coupled folate transporter-like [Danaus plexippus]
MVLIKEEEPLKEEKKIENKKTLRENIAYIRENITLEPVLITFVIPGVLARLATQNLNLDKACRVNLQFGEKICDALIAKTGSNYHNEELKIQELIASMEVWKNIILTAIPSILILFIGAWSDQTGNRKLCILLPIFGDFLMCLSNILNVYYFYELPLEVTMFLEAIFPAMCGGWIATYTGTFSYIGETSSEDNRTFRVGIANLCLTVGGPLGSVLAGILLNYLGYYGVFSMTSLLYCFSICYGIYYIKNPKRPAPNKQVKKVGFLKSFFDIKHVKDTFAVAFKKGPNNRRMKSILVLACVVFIYGPAYGEHTVRYLFGRYRFNWDIVKYSFYNTFYICLHLLGATISITFLSKKLKWQDATLGILSNVSKIIGCIATGLSRTTLEIYVAVVLEMFNATPFTALRSISSKLATSDELGKMTAIFNLTEVVTSMVFGPTFSWIYMVTLKYESGFIYYLSAVVTVPSLMIFIWFYRQHKIVEKEQKTESVNIENGHENDKQQKNQSLVNSVEPNVSSL